MFVNAIKFYNVGKRVFETFEVYVHPRLYQADSRPLKSSWLKSSQPVK